MLLDFLSNKAIKTISIVATAVGGAMTLLSSAVEDRKTQIMITEEVQKALAEMNK